MLKCAICGKELNPKEERKTWRYCGMCKKTGLHGAHSLHWSMEKRFVQRLRRSYTSVREMHAKKDEIILLILIFNSLYYVGLRYVLSLIHI